MGEQWIRSQARVCARSELTNTFVYFHTQSMQAFLTPTEALDMIAFHPSQCAPGLIVAELVRSRLIRRSTK